MKKTSQNHLAGAIGPTETQAPATANRLVAPETLPQAPPPRTAFMNTTIAVIEDDERSRESLASLLEAYGYRTVQCGSRREAGPLLARNEVALVLLDLRLHDESGLDVLKELRAAGHAMPVVVLSGDVMIESAISALQLGAQDYLRKPCAPEILLHRVEATLQRHSLEQSHQRMSREIARSEALHRFLVASSPDVIFILDGDGSFSFVSDGVLPLLGQSAAELLGTGFFWLVADEDLERARTTVMQMRAGDACAIELRLKHQKPGTGYRHFELKLASLTKTSPEWQQAKLPGEYGIYGVARDVTEKKVAHDRLAFQACHDALTGLPNRALFVDRLELAIVQAKRSQQTFAVVFVDLDRFKIINDTYGHLKGDVILEQVGERLKATLRESDTLARLGGDEFIILLSNIRGAEDAGLVANKIVEDMVKPFMLDGREMLLSSSLGIAMFPQDGDDSETLMRHSDIAMYEVKAKGKNGFAFFTPAMNEGSSGRLTVANDLRKALEDGQFDLYYQPQVDALELRVTGLEALIRWNHPTRGLLTAGEFISIAEDLGMMSNLTRWVLERACRDLKSWRDKGIKLERMAINFSPRMIEKPDFIADLMRTLDFYGIAPSSIEVEITENVPFQNMESTTQILNAISARGVRIAIDDFGAQYSSLNYLRSLPIDTLKIDRAFVMEIRNHSDDSPIIKAIVAIASGLGMNVVAEGVETAVQAEFLKSLGCSQMQGYLYGHPQPFSALEQTLMH
ncbi:MAG TPA: EAL domain-containing protein [Burkholderiales bacterium]|jgi:diguanylate cyclase (GGDEF)-like protein/PAS domain S-box-containing protein|nr:EAL domain-containing protein [Burkholderiales bacterium]